MSNHDGDDDLDLLLSLNDDRILETPPESPSNSTGYDSEYELRTRKKKRVGEEEGDGDMSVFKDAVADCMDYDVNEARKVMGSNRGKGTGKGEGNVERLSGLRIRNQSVSSLELNNHFSDIRFVRLSAIKNLIRGDSIVGCWATVGVLTEKGSPKTSSNGKNYCIWKIGSLDEETVSVFLFGDAYQKCCNEPAGTVFGFFGASVRKDPVGTGFSLSVQNPSQILKIGTSVDYGVCRGKRKDGMACTMVINRRRGIYCTFHRSQASQKYSVKRTELKGGNLRTAFRDPFRTTNFVVFDPFADKTNSRMPKQPSVLMSVEGLKMALSNADRVTTLSNSQGIRMLSKITGTSDLSVAKKESLVQKHRNSKLAKRLLSSTKTDSSLDKTGKQAAPKRPKTEHLKISSERIEKDSSKMIELDFVSSDEEI